MSITPLPDEPLAPSPRGSRWGRNAAGVYLGVLVLATAMVVREMLVGSSGLGILAVSVLTAPWSALLAPLAKFLTGRMAPGTLRAAGLVLLALCALLNARILYGIGARAERDARATRNSGGHSHG
jgi:hypothetical protein